MREIVGAIKEAWREANEKQPKKDIRYWKGLYIFTAVVLNIQVFILAFLLFRERGWL